MPTPQAKITRQLRSATVDQVRPFNKAMLAYLVLCRQLSGGDMDKVLVIGTIIQRMNEHPDFQQITLRELKEGATYPLPSRPVSVQSIADSTGIPRESVRRKVSDMIESGWVEKVGTSNNLRITAVGFVRMAPLSEAAHNVVAISSLITEGFQEKCPSR